MNAKESEQLTRGGHIAKDLVSAEHVGGERCDDFPDVVLREPVAELREAVCVDHCIHVRRQK